jgi:DNA-directed RNA polymerase subunit alpha
MQIRNFGKKSLTEVKEKLATLNLALKGSPEGVEGISFSDDSDDETEEVLDEEEEAVEV